MENKTLTKTRAPGVEGPVVVAVMDGVGIGKQDEADAVFHAKTPNLDRYAAKHLSAELEAHGVSVGMPSNSDMGNSEVGHNVIGCGRVFDQGAKLVSEAIASGSLFETETWQQTLKQVIPNEQALHFIGLLSDGNIHSHIDHLIAMIRRANQEGVKNLFVHVLLDGRDVPKTSAFEYTEKLETCIAEIHGENNRNYRIASGGGRMTTTMDRYESDWDMVKRGWEVHVLGQGRGFRSIREAIETLRTETPGIGDQDLGSFVIEEDGQAVGPIHDGDGVILFNFRGDRMLEICYAFQDEAFDKFDRVRTPKVSFSGMLQYDGDTQTPKRFLVAPPQIESTLSELLCDAGVSQFACSETHKFGHVTYFWNGNRSGYFDPKQEEYVEVPSLPGAVEEAPAMQAEAITQAVLKGVKEGGFKFSRLNYANGDMVGHTGDFQATVESVEVVDQMLGVLEKEVLALGGALVVTADHGNADDMAERNKKTGVISKDENGIMIPRTSHSLNLVPMHVVLNDADRAKFVIEKLQGASLANLAATSLQLLGYQAPDDYRPSLLKPVTP